MALGKATLVAEKHSFAFDDRNLRWSKLRDLEHFVFSVFDVDLERGLVDFILKSNLTNGLFFIVTWR
jgi:hypothetical protein